MLAVATPGIDGVTLRRHILDREAAGLAKLAQRLGKRLRVWFRQTEAKPEEERLPTLPDEDTRESMDLYRKCVTDLLKEQRERAKLADKNGAPMVDDSVFEAQIAQLARKAVMEMPRAELEALLTARRMSIVQGATESRESPSPGEPASHRTESAEPDSPTAPPARMSPGGDDSGEPPDLLDFGDTDG